MPPQDQALVNDADLEPMLMNFKKGDRYVVNHGEDLTTVDFGNYVSLAEKEDVDMAGRGDPTRGRRRDLDGKKKRSDGYSRRSRGCSVYVALRKKILAISKEKVRNCHWTTEWRTDRAGADCHGRSHDAVEQWQWLEGSCRVRR
ncbi:hypothetical protein BHM03_00054393 [Ensete ventricosum]|nr:hypothetical protein BHM03_00054393 [Ensete ventricosum]